MSPRRRRVLVPAAVALAVVVVVAACSGVPDSSTPQIVSPIRVSAPAPAATVSPVPGEDESEIVASFLLANVSNDPRHSAARSFLTPDAQRTWSDSTVTVVNNATYSIGLSGSVVTVPADRVGALDASGIYTPDFLTSGSSTGDSTNFQFGMKQVNGQWRIDKLQNGVIVKRTDFEQSYQRRALYFLDPPETLLIPDLRYTAITDPTTLATWLIAQLADGPRPQLVSSVKNELPDQANPGRLSATVEGSQVRVELPGTAQLDSQVRRSLAAQVTVTLAASTAVGDAVFTITDAGRPVTIVSGRQTVTQSDFAGYQLRPPAADLPLFYVLDGAVVDIDANPLAGVLGSKQNFLTSVALFSQDPRNYDVAATVGDPGKARLLVGRQDDRTLTDSRVPAGTLSRPAWAPRTVAPEVWVGRGTTLYRWVRGDVAASAVRLDAQSGPPVSGTISALQFSPDGLRLALAIKAPGASTAQVWVGSVTRSGKQVRIEGMTPVTPPGIDVADLAWNDATTLYLIGFDTVAHSPGYWNVKSDGSGFASRPITGLTSAATSLTLLAGVLAIVSSDGRIWKQPGGEWTSLHGSGASTVPGTAPTYLE